MDYMQEFVSLLGVEFGEPVQVRDFTNNTIYDVKFYNYGITTFSNEHGSDSKFVYNEQLSAELLQKLLTGAAEITNISTLFKSIVKLVKGTSDQFNNLASSVVRTQQVTASGKFTYITVKSSDKDLGITSLVCKIPAELASMYADMELNKEYSLKELRLM